MHVDTCYEISLPYEDVASGGGRTPRVTKIDDLGVEASRQVEVGRPSSS
jgi:hypothetical protein